MNQLSKKVHGKHCNCKPDKTLTNSSSLFLEEIVFNDTDLFQEHILAHHIGPQFPELNELEIKGRAKKVMDKKMDTPISVWINCLFADCGMKLPTARLLIDHLLSQHSQCIMVKVEEPLTEDKLVTMLKYPLGYNTTALANKGQCIKDTGKDGLSYLRFFYDGLLTDEDLKKIKDSSEEHKGIEDRLFGRVPKIVSL